MKSNQLLTTLFFALFSVFAFAQMAGTAHDFSDETWAGGAGDGNNTGQICIVCHIAHNTTSSSGAPLWNRGAVALDGTVTYTAYTSLTFDADDQTGDGSTGDPYANELWADYLQTGETGSPDFGGTWIPDGTSILCLTCHDGVGNLDAYGGTSSGSYVVAAGSDANEVDALSERNDGTNEHPFSFTYSTQLQSQDGGLKDPTSGPVAALLSANKVQCTSCHDVHNSAGISNGLLVMSNAQSALCTTCHAK